MPSRFITNTTDSTTDNFKINVNEELVKPYGDFIEDLHIWVDEERSRLGLDAFVWFLYDSFDGGDLNANFEGQSWSADPVDSDTQRVLYTPHTGIRDSNGKNIFTEGNPSKVVGFEAKIRNYTQDIASGLIPVLAMYNGMRQEADVKGAVKTHLFYPLSSVDSNFNTATSGSFFPPFQGFSADHIAYRMGHSAHTVVQTIGAYSYGEEFPLGGHDPEHHEEMPFALPCEMIRSSGLFEFPDVSTEFSMGFNALWQFDPNSYVIPSGYQDPDDTLFTVEQYGKVIEPSGLPAGDFDPEPDDILNVLRPKVCIASLDSTGKKVRIWNCLGGLLDDNIDVLDDENLLNEWTIRDENFNPESAAATKIVCGVNNIFIFYGNKFRMYTHYGRPMPTNYYRSNYISAIQEISVPSDLLGLIKYDIDESGPVWEYTLPGTVVDACYLSNLLVTEQLFCTNNTNAFFPNRQMLPQLIPSGLSQGGQLFYTDGGKTYLHQLTTVPGMGFGDVNQTGPVDTEQTHKEYTQYGRLITDTILTSGVSTSVISILSDTPSTGLTTTFRRVLDRTRIDTDGMASGNFSTATGSPYTGIVPPNFFTQGIDFNFGPGRNHHPHGFADIGVIIGNKIEQYASTEIMNNNAFFVVPPATLPFFKEMDEPTGSDGLIDAAFVSEVNLPAGSIKLKHLNYPVSDGRVAQPTGGLLLNSNGNISYHTMAMPICNVTDSVSAIFGFNNFDAIPVVPATFGRGVAAKQGNISKVFTVSEGNALGFAPATSGVAPGAEGTPVYLLDLGVAEFGISGARLGKSRTGSTSNTIGWEQVEAREVWVCNIRQVIDYNADNPNYTLDLTNARIHFRVVSRTPLGLTRLRKTKTVVNDSTGMEVSFDPNVEQHPASHSYPAATFKVNKYTGALPPTATASDFDALGTSIMTYSTAANRYGIGRSLPNGIGSFETFTAVSESINLSTLSEENELRLILSVTVDDSEAYILPEGEGFINNYYMGIEGITFGATYIAL